MTAVPSIDPARFLDEQLAQASPDLMRAPPHCSGSAPASS